MSTTTKPPEKESDDAAFAAAVMGMIASGQTHKVLAGYDVSIHLEVTPRFAKTEESGR